MKEKTIISREYVEKELKIHEIPGMTIGVIKEIEAVGEGDVVLRLNGQQYRTNASLQQLFR